MTYKVLMTTPDYPPKLGGLATFSVLLESVLKKIGCDVEVLEWTSLKDLKIKSKLARREKYHLVLNVHFQGGLFLKNQQQLNFFHGSEILFYSSDLLKHIIKRLFRRSVLNHLENAKYNIPISYFTLYKLEELGFKPNFSRDIVWHNCMNTTGAVFCEKEFAGEIILCAIARDVPHKNLKDVVSFAESLQNQTGKAVKLYITSGRFSSDQIEIVSIAGNTSEQLDEVYKQSHFNLLFSKDHSKFGFYEGFGLTVLEAGKFGTPTIAFSSGGLTESVHQRETGWVVDKYEEILEDWEHIVSSYKDLRRNCFDHTTESHSLERLESFMKGVVR